MARRNSQPAWRVAVVELVWCAFMYYFVYLPPLRDLTERLTRFDSADTPFILTAVQVPIAALCDKTECEISLWATVIQYHAASAFCKAGPNTHPLFMLVGQMYAGICAASIIYGYNFLFSSMNV
ncbi:unnamed protein product [Clonostachys byssicola]|uniref:Uncharacterized protein n=1 Tax=Clonostachys byssicola TaxID=160290 RepID=A0A9N9U452_9HYPO|nr:unnamed protein product [Clonostachys byssicola]